MIKQIFNNPVALIGFGFDSIAESMSGIILVWRLKKNQRLIPKKKKKGPKERLKSWMGFLLFYWQLMFFMKPLK